MSDGSLLCKKLIAGFAYYLIPLLLYQQIPECSSRQSVNDRYHSRLSPIQEVWFC